MFKSGFRKLVILEGTYSEMIDDLKTYFKGEQQFVDLGIGSLEKYYTWKIPSALFDGSSNV